MAARNPANPAPTMMTSYCWSIDPPCYSGSYARWAGLTRLIICEALWRIVSDLFDDNGCEHVNAVEVSVWKLVPAEVHEHESCLSQSAEALAYDKSK
jgi:hypothetical protein